MSAEVKITVRDQLGRTVEVTCTGHANEHASSLLTSVSAEVTKQLQALGITTPAK